MDTADSATGPVASERAEPEGVGAFLRARRLQLGLSHADVANVVKLPARRIDALENERWDELPDGPFLRGFLRNVARALDLNATTLMDRVDDSLMRSRNPESILVPLDVPHAPLPRRSGPVDERRGGRALVYGALAFALLAALIAWSGTNSFDRTVAAGRGLIASRAAVPAAAGRADVAATAGRTDVAAAGGAASGPAAAVDGSATGPSDTAAAPVSANPASNPASNPAANPAANPTSGSASNAAPGPASPTATAEASPANTPAAAGSLSFHFNEDSWVEVRAANGRVLLQRLNRAGSEQEVDGDAPFTLIVGNAHGVALRFRGQPVDLAPYTRDQVARLTLS